MTAIMYFGSPIAFRPCEIYVLYLLYSTRLSACGRVPYIFSEYIKNTETERKSDRIKKTFVFDENDFSLNVQLVF